MDLHYTGQRPILPSEAPFPDLSGPKDPQMRRFGFLILALAAMSMFFFPHQRDRTGGPIVPSADKAPAGAAPGTSTAPANTVAAAPKRSPDTALPVAPEPAAPAVKIAAEPALPDHPTADTSDRDESVQTEILSEGELTASAQR